MPIAGSAAFTLDPGEETDVVAMHTFSLVAVSLPDGGEVEFTIGPSTRARLKAGTSRLQVKVSGLTGRSDDLLRAAESACRIRLTFS